LLRGKPAIFTPSFAFEMRFSGAIMPHHNIIVIGASAGGVETLCELTKNLPKGFAASIFVVMHIGSQSSLPEILSRCGKLPAIAAQDGKPYQNGCIYVAPPQSHLALKEGTTILSRGPRENGHRPAIDVLFRSAARLHDSKVIGVILSGGRDDGTAGLYAIKKRGGIAIVQDPSEAIAPDMPRSALQTVDVDFCLPLAQLIEVLIWLVHGDAGRVNESKNGEIDMNDEANGTHPTSEPPGEQVPLACPECNGPIYEVKEGELSRFQCFVGHAFSPESLSEQHTEAFERALWTTIRTLKERTVLHKRLIERSRNHGEETLRQRLEESIASADQDLKLLREVLDRI
jgi:two-component system chemotaxis response regulator CheB